MLNSSVFGPQALVMTTGKWFKEGFGLHVSTEVNVLWKVNKQRAVLKSWVTPVQARKSGSNKSAIR
jgi:hypothetical protein